MISKPKKKLGQVFLANERIAEIEAMHGENKNVIELGPGYGMLTKKLCEKAKHVVAVEKDAELYNMLLSEIAHDNLTLINADFFKIKTDIVKEFRIDIMISNIPYVLSSKVIGWLIEKRMQAVLCLQKEFVEHMLAEPGSKNYSRLSVMSSLQFRITKIFKVSRGNFNPVPKVDSAIIYLKPLGKPITRNEAMAISLLMQHKKKTLRNAVIDSRRSLEISKPTASEIAEKLDARSSRPFSMAPEDILRAARRIIELKNQNE